MREFPPLRRTRREAPNANVRQPAGAVTAPVPTDYHYCLFSTAAAQGYRAAVVRHLHRCFHWDDRRG